MDNYKKLFEKIEKINESGKPLPNKNKAVFELGKTLAVKTDELYKLCKKFEDDILKILNDPDNVNVAEEESDNIIKSLDKFKIFLRSDLKNIIQDDWYVTQEKEEEDD